MVRARFLPLLFVTTIPGCVDPAPVTLRAFFEHDVPVADLEVTAIPFDADRVLDSLGRFADSPRPDFPELRERLSQFRKDEPPAAAEPDPAASVTIAWRATRDSVNRMAAELSRQDRKSPTYREAYARFRQLYTRYTAREAERESRLRAAGAGDRDLASAVTRASDSLRQWESAAYRDFPRLAEERVRALGRTPRQIRTDSLGIAELELDNGDWWVRARLPDPDNPFQELHWSVPVRLVAGLPVSIPLARENARVEWKH